MINILMDLVGKEFTSIKFNNDKILFWGGNYPKTLGKVGIIKNLHLDNPEYVCIRFENVKRHGVPIELHWHIDIVNEQIYHNERVNNPRYVDILYEEIFKAIKQICQNKRK